MRRPEDPSPTTLTSTLEAFVQGHASQEQGSREPQYGHRA